MSDIKITSGSKQKSRRGFRKLSLSRGINVPMDGNRAPYKTQFSIQLASGTTGIISQVTSPSIANSSEYSTLQALYTEIKLIRCRLTYSSLNPTALTGQSRLVVSTNMAANGTTFVAPTGLISVQNGKRLKRILSAAVMPQSYNMYVPRSLDYSLITADAPATPTPWAGSPGVVYGWGSGFPVSIIVFDVDVECWFICRGRQ